jgi:hypothetical protein
MEAPDALKKVDDPPEPAPRLRVERLCRRVFAWGRQFGTQKKSDILVGSSPLSKGKLRTGHVEINRPGPDMLSEIRRQQEFATLIRDGSLTRELVKRTAHGNESTDQDGARRDIAFRFTVKDVSQGLKRAFSLQTTNTVSIRGESRRSEDPTEGPDFRRAEGRLRQRVEIGSVIGVQVSPGQGPDPNKSEPDHQHSIEEILSHRFRMILDPVHFQHHGDVAGPADGGEEKIYPFAREAFEARVDLNLRLDCPQVW